jgi:hypothetical protein
MTETPFDNVEGAHEYVSLLVEAVRQARDEVGQDLERAREEGTTRTLEALQVVAWKLERLESQLGASRHLLNDLRRLRRLLLGDDSALPISARPGGPDDSEGGG